MVRINFLPWRKEAQRMQIMTFLGLLVIAVIVAIVVSQTMLYTSRKNIAFQQSRVQFLEEKVNAVQKKLSKVKGAKEEYEKILKKNQGIQLLQQLRFTVVQMLNELVKLVPQDVNLEKMVYENNVLELDGYATSGEQVSVFMKNIENSAWFQEPILKEMTKEGEHGRHVGAAVFTLQIKPTYKQ